MFYDYVVLVLKTLFIFLMVINDISWQVIYEFIWLLKSRRAVARS